MRSTGARSLVAALCGVVLLPAPAAAQPSPTYEETVAWLTAHSPLRTYQDRGSGWFSTTTWHIAFPERCVLEVREETRVRFSADRRYGVPAGTSTETGRWLVQLGALAANRIGGMARSAFGYAIWLYPRDGRLIPGTRVKRDDRGEHRRDASRDYVRLYATDDMGARIVRALQHAARLCGARDAPPPRPEPF